MRENLFAQDCLRTGLDTAVELMLMPGNWFVMVIWLVMWCMTKNQFLVLDNGTGTGCRIQMILGDGVGYDIDECGRLSISSWLIVALPSETEINLNSPNFKEF